AVRAPAARGSLAGHLGGTRLQRGAAAGDRGRRRRAAGGGRGHRQPDQGHRGRGRPVHEPRPRPAGERRAVHGRSRSMTVTAPQGFRASGVTAGLKPSGKPDVALVVNDGPSSVAAAVFTANRCKANPVLWSEQVMTTRQARAVVLNSGGANCYTG